ncbi:MULTISPECIES: DUF4405 domain-containing protein [unclassified Aureimonas]|uniref:DUF4405 domain-containing protein n=1 Tax=unclassified Aureimonas TaxID=2615206 RepID=UPI0009E7EB82|nr:MULTISPECIES: DUF4405 domain-containing protein [unclassified Aureimonas]
MTAMLLLSLAYWWLGNIAHELFGTALFALLVWHVVTNRRWFANLAHGRYDGRRVAKLVLHLLLVINMAVLLVTSVVISKSVFAPLPIPDSIYLREVHWFSAYWVMIVVGIHVGLHWTRVMALVRKTLGLAPGNATRTWTLRLLAAMLGAFGLWSWFVLGVWSKLTFTYSLDFWDFTAAVAPFFGHWVGVLALPAIAAFYVTSLTERQKRTGSGSSR